MLRPALLLCALLVAAPLASANVVDPLDSSKDPIVEVRECHSRYESFQVFVNDDPVTDCFVFCCDETAQATASSSGPEIRDCPGGFYVVWEPYFITTCIPVPDPIGDGPEVRQCPGGFYVVWEPYFITTCIPVPDPIGNGPEVRQCPGGFYVVWEPYFITTCFPGLNGGPEVRDCPGGFYVVWEPYFVTTCIRV